MQTVSETVRQLVDAYAPVTLAVYVDGEKLDASIDSSSYSGACAGDDEFSFGNACAAGMTIDLARTIHGLKDRRIQVTWAVDDTEHPLLTGKIGRYKVTAGHTEVEAWDDMYFAGSEVFEIPEDLLADCAADVVFAAVASAMGVEAEQASLDLLADVTIPGGLSNLAADATNSAVAGHVAGLIGGNALMTRDGLLCIRQYSNTGWETEPYSGGAAAENEDFTVTGITLQRKVTTTDTNEDGATSEVTETAEYAAGDGSLMFTNPLADQAAADRAYAALQTLTVRPGSFSFPGGLLLEPGDLYTVHSMDGSYVTAVGSIAMSFDGGVKSSVACGGTAESGGAKGAINQALNALVVAFAKFKKLVAENAEIARITAGIIKSKDGTSIVIDLDNGEVDVTGSYETTKNYSSGYYEKAKLSGGELKLYRGTNSNELHQSVSLDSDSLSFDSGIYGQYAMHLNGPGDYDPVYESLTCFDWGTFSRDFFMSREDGEQICSMEQTMSHAIDGTELKMKLGNGRALITGLTAPVDAADAVNKEYVDGKVLSKTYTNTTNSNGNIGTGLGEGYIILTVSAADADGSEAYLCHLYKNASKMWCVNVADVITKENIANTEFTLTIYYMKA